VSDAQLKCVCVCEALINYSGIWKMNSTDLLLDVCVLQRELCCGLKNVFYEIEN